jgi:hypothetical protein
MSLYLDTAYIAKCYLNEPDAQAVRAMVRGETDLYSSALCRAELACVFHRHFRDGGLTHKQADRLRALFREDLETGVWNLIPVSTEVLDEVDEVIGRLRRNVFVRGADAIHLLSAKQAGFSEIWSSDRHMIAAAKYLGLGGRQVAR